jgi:hypothetical protein
VCDFDRFVKLFTPKMLNILFLQVRVNLPNGDMVGHTGDIEATVVACKAADEAVKVRTKMRR